MYNMFFCFLVFFLSIHLLPGSKHEYAVSLNWIYFCWVPTQESHLLNDNVILFHGMGRMSSVFCLLTCLFILVILAGIEWNFTIMLTTYISSWLKLVFSFHKFIWHLFYFFWKVSDHLFYFQLHNSTLP